MGRQYTGKQITRTAEVKQKNGDVYVYERVYQYDRDKKKTVIVSNRLIGKRRAGETEIVPMGSADRGQQALLLPAGADASAPVAAPADRKCAAAGGPGGPLTAAELRRYAEQQSCLREAAELCLPDEMREPILVGLWNALMQREIPGNGDSAVTPHELSRRIADAHGLMDAVLRAQLLRAGSSRLTLTALGGEPGHVFFQCGSRLLGERTLPEMLTLPAGLEQVWNEVGAGDLMLQQSFLDTPVTDSGEIRALLRRTLDFVCPFSAQTEMGRRLLTETALTRRQTQTLLEPEEVWASTFPLRLGATLEIVETSGAELFLHIYSFPAQRDSESAQFEEQLDRLRGLLAGGLPLNDLDARAQGLRQQFLREDSDGSWTQDEEACRQHMGQLGCLMLLANGERDARAAFALEREARRRQRWLKRLSAERLNLSTEILIAMLRDSLTELIRAARNAGGEVSGLEERMISDAAGAYLLNASLGEVLSMLFGPEPDSEAGRARREAVSARLRRAAGSKKAAPAVH